MDTLSPIKKKNKLKPVKAFGSFCTALLLFFGAASCNSGSGDPNVLADEEHVKDKGYDQVNAPVEDDPQFRNNEEFNFDKWDADADQQWDEREYQTASRGAGFYNEWDTDQDGAYSEREVNTGVFNRFDRDGDGVLSSQEFEDWNSAWGGDFQDRFSEWDSNSDEVLDDDEYNTGANQFGLLSDWETSGDQIFGESEVDEGLFNTWDADGDGYINREEYERIGGNEREE